MAAKPLVLSVSRRTDIPAFYLPWFLEGLHKGFFITKNPVSGKPCTIPATKEKVAGFVFWSKNYASFLEQKIGEKILSMGLGIYFQFTVNSPHPLLEPGVPPLRERLAQLEELSQRFGADRISWRWDPICHWKDLSGKSRHNMDAFPEIAKMAARAGIPGCTTSFLDLYPKVLKRAEKKNVFFYDPSEERKKEILFRMAEKLGDLGMELFLCCEDALLPALEPHGVKAARCISGALLEQTFGPVSQRKDPGQRRECHCSLSRDIGSYGGQRCLHSCLYCYAS